MFFKQMKVEKDCLESIDRFVATSPQAEKDLRTLVSSKGKIDVIPCGTDLDRFGSVSKMSGRDRLGIALDEKVVLYVGRFDRRKGIDTLVRAVDRSRFRNDRLLLIIGGGSRPGQSDGIERDRIENMVTTL